MLSDVFFREFEGEGGGDGEFEICGGVGEVSFGEVEFALIGNCGD